MECNDTVRCIITYPTNISSPTPTVFKFPGSSNRKLSDSVYWNESKFYREFVASNGYVSVTMQWNNENDYGCAYYMLEQAAQKYGQYIDTTRVGIHGMSQGAGVTNWLSLKKYINDGWGTNGRFAWPMQVQVLLDGWTIGQMTLQPKPTVALQLCPTMFFIS
jgi:hypothetical protein